MVARERPTEATRIVSEAGVLAGKPVVKGTRIPVELVLNYLAQNPNFDDLFADYPRLSMEDVRACFAFAQRAVESRGRTRGRGTGRPGDPPSE